MRTRSFVLNRLYPKAADGLPVLGTPQAAAARARSGSGSLRARGETLAKRHVALASATGFASGLGGGLTLALALPANIAGVALIQLHLAASVAALAGLDPGDPAVRERVLACLLRPVATSGPDHDAEEETTQRVGVKLAERGLKLLSGRVLGFVRRRAGGALRSRVTRRLARGGRWARLMPVVGGFISGASDAYATRLVAQAALDEFLPAAG